MMILPGVLLPGFSSAQDILVYRDHDGQMLFTDRKVYNSAYTLLSVRKGWDYRPKKLTAAVRNQYDMDIAYAARSFDVEPALVKAVIHAESHFNPFAESRAGAQGLMQLMPETARYLQVHRPFNARQNILGGTRFLSYLAGKFNSLEHILAAYNAGEGNVRKYKGIPPFPETQNYVVKVKELLASYRKEFSAERLVAQGSN